MLAWDTGTINTYIVAYSWDKTYIVAYTLMWDIGTGRTSVLRHIYIKIVAYSLDAHVCFILYS